MLKILTPFLVFFSALYSRDCGKHGTTFPILEEDFIEHIQRGLSDELLEKLTREKVESLKNPPPVEGLCEAAAYTCAFLDPSITASQDILDGEGNIIIRKGTTLNPLDQMTLSDDILFFDGSNETHVAWAQNYPNAYWVLVRGSPFELEKELNRPIYYDQSGALKEKFSLKSIPTRISQQGRVLKIEEIPLTSSNFSKYLKPSCCVNSEKEAV